jgi:integrase
MIKSVSIKDHGGDITKRWYVEYYELNHDTKKWRRVREYQQVNREKNPEKRRELLQDLCAEIMHSLSTRITGIKKGENEMYKYIRSYIIDKQNSLRGTSMKNIKLALKYFYKFLCDNNYHNLRIHEIKKRHLHEFRIALSSVTGNRSVNGHMSFVKSFFNYYIDNYDDILFKNPCAGLKKLPTMSETHVAYTNDQVNEAFKFMQEHDQQMLLYCKFVGLGFIRCNEARNLKIGDIDFNRRTVTISAGYSKTRRRVVKPLLGKFFEYLFELKLYDHAPEHYIFTNTGQPGEEQVGKNYFRKRFKKLKDDFKLSDKHTIYGFRHTFVSQLIENGAKWHEVMKYTGHTTMEAFSNYVRSLHVKPAEDLSKFLN